MDGPPRPDWTTLTHRERCASHLGVPALSSTGWFTDNKILLRLLGGLDGAKMAGVTKAYDKKYGRPLDAALREEISGDFGLACQVWIRALDDPTRGAEEVTDRDPNELEGDLPGMQKMLDYLLLENNSILGT